MTTYTRPGTYVNTTLTPLLSSPGAAGGSYACFAAAYNIGPTRPTLVTSWQQYTNLYGSFAVANGSPLTYAVWQYFTNGGTGCYVYRVPNTDAVLASVTIGSVETATTNGETASVNPSLLTFTANNPGAWANDLYVEVVPGAPASTTDPTSTFTVNVYNGGTNPANLVETWPSVSLNPASSRNLLALLNATGSGSNYVTAYVSFAESTGGTYTAGDGSSDPAATAVNGVAAPVPLAGGSDGTAAPDLATAIIDGIASPESATYAWSSPGLGSLTSIMVNLNMPGAPSQSILNSVIAWAESVGNVFVVIDAPFGGIPLLPSSTLVSTYQSFLSGSGSTVNASSVAAMYGPWLSISDPAASTTTATRWVAPGGAVLGYWAVNDAMNSVSQTPAGTTATVAAGALEAYFTNTDLSTLETMQVNPIKLIQNAGFCIFGGRTLAQGYQNRYINVSRTIMQFTLDFINITQFAIFQNNDPTLWQSITTVLTNYLMQAMQNGMLAGTTPDTAFSVLCDSTTTSPAQAQAGIVNAVVAVALVSPAEFIIINLSQMQSGGTATVTSS